MNFLDPKATPEIQESTTQLRETLARKRAAKKAEEEANKAVIAIMTHVEGIPSEEASLAPDKIISPVRSGVKFATAVARFLPVDEQVRKEIVENFVYQENNWDTLEQKDMHISAEEIIMWESFLNSAKNTDFIPQTCVNELQIGETVYLELSLYENFQLVKIRTKDKKGAPLCVVRSIKKDSKKSQTGAFFITLPFSEGKGFLISGKETGGKKRGFTSEKVFVNTKQGLFFR